MTSPGVAVRRGGQAVRLATGLLALTIAAVPATALVWTIERADAPKAFAYMGDRSLLLDSESHPHISYGADRLYYAWHDGDNWHYEIVDDSPGVGSLTSLAVDREGCPHIAYYDAVNGILKHAWKPVARWIVEPSPICGPFWAIGGSAVDSAGHLHVAYEEEDTHHLLYAYEDSCGWHAEPIYEAGRVGHSSLILEEGSKAHAAFCDYGASALIYAFRDGPAWQVEQVDAGFDVGLYSSIAVDREGNPHIGYYSYAELRYACRHDSQWHTERVAHLCAPTDRFSLTLDNEGSPHIAYPGDYLSLHHAHRDNNGWQVDIVDSGLVNRVADPSVAVTEHGAVGVSYAGDYELRYAESNGGGWEVQTVDRMATVGLYTSLAVDQIGHLHLSYGGGSGYDLKYAYRDGSGWRIELVDSEVRLDHCTAIAVDDDHHVHIGYGDWVSDQLKYAFRNASGWHLEVVETHDDPEEWGSLVLDEDDFPHIAFRTYRALRHARRDSLGWHIETVDSGRTIGYYASMTLDNQGQAIISYYDRRAPALMCARESDTGWRSETVDSGAIVGGRTSVAVDTSGHPHIGYPTFHGGVLYAYRNSTGWRLETVDASGSREDPVSLALDCSGRPLVSYTGDDDLRWAYRSADGWQTEVVDAQGRVGEHSSMALDTAGNPFISYYDFTCGDLKLACAEGALPQPPKPTVTALLWAAPNPLVRETTIRYSLSPASGEGSRHVWLRVYDCAGRRVASLADHLAAPGSYAVRWNLDPHGGPRVPPGVYFLRLEADNPRASDVRRIVVVR